MSTNYRNQNFTPVYKLVDRYKSKINPGLLLLAVALITIVIANSPLRFWYNDLWSIELNFGTESFNFLNHHGEPLTLLQFVNDVLMTVFFFIVGLEIKREVLVGELSSIRQVALPFFAACGGMIVPVLFFFVTGKIQGFGPVEMKGIAIPMATDIAFSLGLLGMFSRRVPLCLKVFLLTLAIVDDIGGIIIIALFYSDITLTSLIYLGASLIGFVVLFIGSRKLEIRSKVFYIFVGAIIWYLFLQGGIHPTIAGVLVAFFIPARPRLDIKAYTNNLSKDLDLIRGTINYSETENILLSNMQVRYLSRIKAASDQVISPIQDIEDNLSGFVNYLILPVFAFANAGVFIDTSVEGGVFSGVALAIIIGLVFGKSLGIFAFAWLAIKMRLSRMPVGMTWANVFALSLLGGVGFTVALFLGGLAYGTGSDLLNQAKIGVLSGSIIAGVLGMFCLNKFLPRAREENEVESRH